MKELGENGQNRKRRVSNEPRGKKKERREIYEEKNRATIG